MKIVTLCKYDETKIYGITFKKGEPNVVEDHIGADLETRGQYQVRDCDDASAEGNGSSDGDTGSIDLLDVDVIRVTGPPRKIINTLDGDLSDAAILLKRLGAIGDVLYVMTVADEIKRRFPTCRITLAVRDNLVLFAALADCIDEAIPYDLACKTHTIDRHTHVVHFNDVLEEAAEETDYFDLHYARAQYLYDVPKTYAPLCVSGLSAHDIQSEADEVLKVAGIHAEPFVIVMLGTSNPLKTIVKDTLEKVIASLTTGENRVRVLCVGSTFDREPDLPNDWASIANQQRLVVSCELARRAKVVFGGDTGVVQFAAAIGTPTIGYFGPTDPLLNLSHFPGLKRAIQAPVDCSPCRVLRKCFCPRMSSGSPDCMRQVHIETIEQEVKGAFLKYKDQEVRLTEPVQGRAIPEKIMSVAQMKDAYDPARFNVGMLIDNTENYTGGGFYAWSVAKAFALSASGCDVWVMCDSADVVYAKDGGLPKNMHVVAVSFAEVSDELGRACPMSLIIGTPPSLGDITLAWGREDCETAPKRALLVYETPAYIAAHRQGLDGEAKYWEEYKACLEIVGYAICISRIVKDSLLEWVPALKRASATRVIRPSIRDDVADVVLSQSMRRENRIILISRNFEYKDLSATLDVLTEDVAPHVASSGCPLIIDIIGQFSKRLRKKHGQKVDGANIILNCHENLSEIDKWQLLKKARIMIHPSTFEGFGIPPAEAMYAQLPVIVKPLEVFKMNYGPHPFYCNTQENLADTARRLLQSSTVGSGQLDSLLSEARAFAKKLFTEGKMISNVRQFIKTQFRGAMATADSEYARNQKEGIVLRTQDKSSSPQETPEASSALEAPPLSVTKTGLRVAMVTTINTKCGIAETTRDWLSKAKCVWKVFAPSEHQTAFVSDDDGNVHRGLWDRRFSEYSELLKQIVEFRPDVVHFQHEFSFFQTELVFLRFLKDLKERQIKTVLTLHTYQPSGPVDRICAAVDMVITTKSYPEFVPNPKFMHINLPIPSFPRLGVGDAVRQLGWNDQPRFIVGSFGLWNAHKGFGPFFETYNDVAVRSGSATRYMVVGHRDHRNTYATEVIRSHMGLKDSGQLHLFTDFDPMEKVAQRLSAANVLVFNYSIVGHSSSSAAIRTGMSIGRPIVCTHSPMFEEFNHEEHVLKVGYGDVQELGDAIVRLARDKELCSSLVARCDQFVQACRPELIAAQHEDLYSRM